MVHLLTLGESVVETGRVRVGPAAPHMFGALLYLLLESGRRVPRGRLQEVLFPTADEPSAAHSLRQLLYRIRRAGVDARADGTGILVPAESVEADYHAFLTPTDAERADISKLLGGVLPGFAPTFSRPFAEWLELRRAELVARIRRTLTIELANHRRAARWHATEQTARAILSLDQFNEEATLALAEAMALSGSKLEAVQLLDAYLREVGPREPALRIPAAILKRRIAERLDDLPYATTSPFVGRDEPMRVLRGLLDAARAGQGSACHIWGDAGIGKTRLVSEFARAAVLDGVCVQQTSAQPHDVRRPMSAFIDLVPNLLRLPGALGCSPEAIGFLKRLVVHDDHALRSLSASVRDAELISGCITQAISEMLDALAAESTLVLVVEDAQWLDGISLRVLADLVAERKQRSLLLVLTSRQSTLYTDSAYQERLKALKVKPLAADASRLLLAQLVASRGVEAEPAFLDWSLSVAAGNPFFLHALAAHRAVTRDCTELPEPLSALLAHRLSLLDGHSRRIFEACSVLGRHATLERLERLLGISPIDFLDGLDVLERHGFVSCEGARVQTSHALLSDLAIRLSSPGVRTLLHRNAAKVLEQSANDRANPTLHWDCAEHWLEAGEKACALTRLRSCARHVLEIGRPDDACELLYRAETLAETTSERIDILEERILTHEIAGSWGRLGEDVRTYLQLAAQHDLPITQPHLYRILALESLMRTGEDPSSFLADLRACARDSTAPTPLRVRAASAVMMLAEDLMSPDLATEAFDAVGPPELEACGMSPERVRMELVYYSLLGRLDDSIALARRAVRYGGRTPAEECRVLSLCGFALLRAGELVEGRSMFEQCFRKASRYRVYSMQLHAAASLACVLRDAELNPDALHWHAVATELLRQGSGRLSLNCFANAVLFAIDRRDFECALGWLDRASEVPAVRSGYPQLIFLALRIRVRQLAEGYVCSEAELQELLRGHFRARGLGHHDEVVVTLWNALAAHGRSSYGDELLRAYLVDHRKMRWPLSPELRQLALLLRPPIDGASAPAHSI